MYVCIYIYIYIYLCASIYVWTHVNVCEGPYHPLRFGRRGCCFLRVRTLNLTSTLRHPTGWLISNFLIALTGDIIFLSQCLLLWCTLHKWFSHAPQPCAPTVDRQPTIRTQINKLAFCSSLTTSTLVPKPYYNRLILSDSERTAPNTYAKVT